MSLEHSTELKTLLTGIVQGYADYMKFSQTKLEKTTEETKERLRSNMGDAVQLSIKDLNFLEECKNKDAETVRTTAAAALDRIDPTYRESIAELLMQQFGIDKIPGKPAGETLHD